MDIDVKTGKLREKAGDQKNIRNELNRINSSIQTSRRKLRSCLSSSASGKIDKSLDVACKSLQNITDRIGNMADGLDTIAGLYEAAEQDISGNKPSGEAVREAGGAGEAGSTVQWKDIILDILKYVFGLGALLSSGAILANLVTVLMEKLGNVIPKSSGGSLDALWKNKILENAAVGKSQPAEAVEKKSTGESSNNTQSNSKKTAGGTGNGEKSSSVDNVSLGVINTNIDGTNSAVQQNIYDLAQDSIGTQGSFYQKWYNANGETPYCAIYAMYIARNAMEKAGYSKEQIDSIVPKYASTSLWASHYNDEGRYYSFTSWQNGKTGVKMSANSSTDSYLPNIGDFVAIDNSGDAAPDHTGIVIAVDGDNIVVAEGNTGSGTNATRKVKTYTYRKSASYWYRADYSRAHAIGFANPAYG